MTPEARNARDEAEALIDRIKAARPGTSKRQIAEAAGVGGDELSKFYTEGKDFRFMPAVVKERLADRFGWDVVYGPSLAAAKWSLCRVTAPAPGSPIPTAMELACQTSSLARDVVLYLEDGRFSDDEHEQATENVRRMKETTARLEAQLEAKRGAR